MIVPSAETKIQTTNEGKIVVDDNELFVMRPVEGHVSRVLEDIVIWVPHDDDVSVAFGAFGAEGLEGMFRVLGIAGESGLGIKY